MLTTLDAHYLGRDVQLAEAAVPKLEKRTKLQNDLLTAADSRVG